MTFEQRGQRDLGVSHVPIWVTPFQADNMLSTFYGTVAIQERGFYGEQERHGSCPSRNVLPECLLLPGLGEGCGAGMRWG